MHTSNMVHELSHNRKIHVTGTTTFVYFTASWCGPCQELYPVFEDLECTTSSCVFLKVDVDKHTELCDEYHIDSIPTVIVLKNGTEVKRISANKRSLQNLVSEFSVPNREQ